MKAFIWTSDKNLLEYHEAGVHKKTGFDGLQNHLIWLVLKTTSECLGPTYVIILSPRSETTVKETAKHFYSLTVYSGGILAPNPKAGNILSLKQKKKKKKKLL